MSRRTERIAEQLRSEIARVLREDATDPRIGLVTLTRVDVSPDLRNAIVFWSSLDATLPASSDVEDAERERALVEVGEGLERASGFVRRQVAQVLSLKRMPELRFRHDPSLELGGRTLAVLREIEDGEER